MFSLCLELGYPHPDYLKRQLTGAQLVDWQNYHARNPIGQFRADFNAGMICAILHNVHKGKDDQAKGPDDFMPFSIRKPKDDSPEAIMLAFEQMATQAGIKIIEE